MERMDQPDVRPNADPMGPDLSFGGQQQSAQGGDFATDPVCGTLVDKRTARYTANYAGNKQTWDTFYFESDECKQLFERDPERYVNPLP
jgi:YHS domain-containing protein